MSAIATIIREHLKEDLVCHALLLQCVRDDSCDSGVASSEWTHVLKELLTNGDVEIGTTHLATPEYVEFIAWSGSVEERVARAIERIDSVTGHDKGFAYWLCLRENVDRFEQEHAAG